MGEFIHDHKVVRAKNAVAVGTTDVESDGVNCAGFGEVTFLVLFGTLTDGTISIHLEQSSDDGDADAYADLAGSDVELALTDDNKCAAVTAKMPVEAYVRCVVERDGGSTGAVVDGIIAILGNPVSKPVAQDTDHVAADEFHFRPAPGTK